MAEAAPPTVTRLDFAKIKGLEDYAGNYAIIIDNAFTQPEIDELIKKATNHAPWDIAQINVGGDMQITNTDYRNSKRIIYDSVPVSKYLFDRVRPYLDDVATLDPKTQLGKAVMGVRARSGNSWQMVGLNERLRFLRYQKGEFFQPHCDGAYTRPDESESSFLTFQVYLEADELVGGATRFYLSKGWDTPNDKTAHWDCDAVPGRVLIFQHARLLHSGERVVSGVKIAIRTDIMFKPDELYP